MLKRFALIPLMVAGLAAVAASPAHGEGFLAPRLDYDFVNGVEWRVTNPDPVDHQYYIVYNDENNKTWFTGIFTAPANETHEFASTTYVLGNGVVLKASLYTPDGRKVSSVRLNETR